MASHSAEAAEPPQSEALSLRNRADYEAYIDREAPKYGVSPETIKAIVSCETGNTWNPSIQSGYYRNGIREESYGLAQINLPSHPDISYAQATNPKFALDYLIKNLHNDRWSCEDLI